MAASRFADPHGRNRPGVHGRNECELMDALADRYTVFGGATFKPVKSSLNLRTSAQVFEPNKPVGDKLSILFVLDLRIVLIATCVPLIRM